MPKPDHLARMRDARAISYSLNASEWTGLRAHTLRLIERVIREQAGSEAGVLDRLGIGRSTYYRLLAEYPELRAARDEAAGR